ncbi:MAG TPA: hypothetical protein RMH99_18435, partial [Sandaracinaceae bacterium LLY-WYZ-13_1]|nr:hypothetical protein [Sandaracinaceae bacterium LLY-WYZ-13_1]
MKSTDRAPGEGFLVLWVGGRDPREAGVQQRLRDEGVVVEEVALDGLVARTNRRAPDLVVLAGMAARAPDAFVRDLVRTEPGASVPVVTLGPSDAARPKATSRFGLVARLDAAEEPEQTGKRLSMLLRGLSRRSPRWRVKVALEELPSLARRMAVAGRCGLLASAEGGALAIDATGAVGPEPGLLVASLTGTLEPELALHERPPGRVRVLREAPGAPSRQTSLEGARVLLIDEDAERAQRLAARLQAAGAQTRATGIVSQAIHAGRGLDPTAVVVQAGALIERPLAPLWNDPRLAVASLLVLDGGALEADPSALLGEVARRCAPELTLRRRLVRREALAERLETLGPTRWLKVLGQCRHEVTFRLYAADGRGRVDLADGKIQGATFRPSDPRSAVVEGRAAVETLLGLRFGRVLAGPPGELGKLEGMRRRRRQSVVGRIVPTPPSGVHRKKGLVTEEVVASRSGAPRIVVPKPGGVAVPPPRSITASPEPRPPRSSRPTPAAPSSTPPRAGPPAVPLGDLADDEDVPTRSYSAAHASALQEQLRQSAKAGGGERPSRRRPLPPTLDELPAVSDEAAPADDGRRALPPTQDELPAAPDEDPVEPPVDAEAASAPERRSLRSTRDEAPSAGAPGASTPGERAARPPTRGAGPAASDPEEAEA